MVFRCICKLNGVADELVLKLRQGFGELPVENWQRFLNFSSSRNRQEWVEKFGVSKICRW